MSSISQIGGASGVNSLLSENKSNGEEGKVSFQDLLTNAIKEADDAYVTASKDNQALLSGEVDNLAGVLINATKAELSLNMVIQVRNKIVDAYSEIMRMQV